MVATELLNTLYVTRTEARLGVEHDALVVRVGDERPQRFPLARIESVVLFGPIVISPSLIARCASEGRTIVILDRNGRFQARIEGPLTGSVMLRRKQHEMLNDRVRVSLLARNLVAGKLQNSRRMLLRAARDQSDSDVQAALRMSAGQLAAGIEQIVGVTDLDTLRGFEGQGANAYFSAYARLFGSAQDFEFVNRSRRPPRDPVNAVLSFGYALLTTQCRTALETVGLDPQVGYLHALRAGRPALALDLMEEFRSFVVDRLVVRLFNRRQLSHGDFDSFPGGAVRLNDRGRRTMLTEWQRQTERDFDHVLAQRQVSYGLLPQLQARILSRFVRGDLEAYVPALVRG